MKRTRCFLLPCLFLLTAHAAYAQEAVSQAPAMQWRHALSLMDTPKYPAHFPHFDYVNPAAPKGGSIRLSALGSFDSFNLTLPRGSIAAGIGNIYDTLMTSSYDEVASEYGLLAEAVSYPEDYSAVSYRLREGAKWHDGTPITTEDVQWSLETLRKNHPFYAQYYRNVKDIQITDERTITFTFDEKGNRELPQILGQLPILPKHWWTDTNAQGQPRNITQTSLEPPLGSGAYRIRSFNAGRSITYERVPDYWAKDLAVNAGKNNFDTLHYEYFRDGTVAFEAFKGGQYDFRVESSAKDWATGYDFPARQQGTVKLEEYTIKDRGIMQAFAFNLRRPQFQDMRVRQAFNLAMNYEAMNNLLFFGQYSRINSYFENTELASTALPEGIELELLESVRENVPESVFTTPYINPENGTPELMRANLQKAVDLLKQAGWTIREETDPTQQPSWFTRILASVGLSKLPTRRVLRNEQGQPFVAEFLIDQPNFERVVLFYKQNLDLLGIDTRIRRVDSTEMENRERRRDFDIIVASWPQSLSPGNEQRDFWGSDAADREGSYNYSGIKNPAVDALIDKVIYAKDRDTLIAATRALDRVLLANSYVVPQWTSSTIRYAFWDKFAHPDPLPEYNIGFPTVWWAKQ